MYLLLPERIRTTLWHFLCQWDDTLSFHAKLFHCFLLRLLARHGSVSLVLKGSDGMLAIILGPIFALTGLSDNSGVSRAPGLRPSSWDHFPSKDAGIQCPPKRRYGDIPWFLFPEGSPANNQTVPIYPTFVAHATDITHSLHNETQHFLVSSEMPGSEDLAGNYNISLPAIAGFVALWLIILVVVIRHCSNGTKSHSTKHVPCDAVRIDVDPTADLDEWLIRPLFDDDNGYLGWKATRHLIDGGAGDLEKQRAVMPGAWFEEQEQQLIIGVFPQPVVDTVEILEVLLLQYEMLPTMTSNPARESSTATPPASLEASHYSVDMSICPDGTEGHEQERSNGLNVSNAPSTNDAPAQSEANSEIRDRAPLTVSSKSDSTVPREGNDGGAEGAAEPDLDHERTTANVGHVGKSLSTSTPENCSVLDPVSSPPLIRSHTDESASSSEIDDHPEHEDVSDSDSRCAEVILPKKRYEYSVLGRRTNGASPVTPPPPLRRVRSTGYLLKNREVLDDADAAGWDTFWADQVDARLSDGGQDLYRAPRRTEYRDGSCDPFWYQGRREDEADNWRERHLEDIDIGKERPSLEKGGEVEHLGIQIGQTSTRQRRYSMPPLKVDKADAESPNLSSNRADRSADTPQGRYVVPQKRAQTMRDPHLSSPPSPRPSSNVSSKLGFFPFKTAPSLLVADAWSPGCLYFPNLPVDEFRQVDEWWDSMTLLFKPAPAMEASVDNDEEVTDGSRLESEPREPTDPGASEGRTLDIPERKRERTASSQGAPSQFGRQDAGISWRDRYENDPATRRFISGHRRSATGGP
ncbi:hypothetical protein BS17DRAFT_881205 [Gyrodon lividus]|nr:hypothetical protein BS17DRAFT_881205 [Gyrodon lividus]